MEQTMCKIFRVILLCLFFHYCISLCKGKNTKLGNTSWIVQCRQAINNIDNIVIKRLYYLNWLRIWVSIIPLAVCFVCV